MSNNSKGDYKNQIRLVTRGDDGGLNHSSNQAIYDACERGILRNVSVMAPAPAFKEMAEMLQGLKQICVGLHACLNAEWKLIKWGPVLSAAKVPSLVNEYGHFWPHPRQLHDNKPVVEEALSEINTQLVLARQCGLNIKYLDEHMAFGWMSRELEEGIFKLCAREGIISSALLMKEEKLKRLPGRDEKGADRIAILVEALQTAPPGTYLLVGHPAYNTEEMRLVGSTMSPNGQEGRNRDEQRRFFMDERMVSLGKTNAILPIRYTEV